MKHLTKKSRRIVSYLVLFAMLAAIVPIGLAPVSVKAAWGGFAGAGTQLDPYRIYTAEDLDHVRDNLTRVYRLENDIDMTDYLADPAYLAAKPYGWLPIGLNTANLGVGDGGSGTALVAANYFTGQFEGNNKTISGLWFNLPNTDNVGLFSLPASGLYTWNVVRLTVATDAARGGVVGRSCVGIIAGQTNNGIQLTTVLGPVTATGNADSCAYVGGIVGYLNSAAGQILQCNSYATVNMPAGIHNAGGLVGFMNHNTGNGVGAVPNIRRSASFADMSGCLGSYIGGITAGGWRPASTAANFTVSGIIEDCLFVGKLPGASEYVGGILGGAHRATTGTGVAITRCYAAPTFVGTPSATCGSLIGNIQTGWTYNRNRFDL